LTASGTSPLDRATTPQGAWLACVDIGGTKVAVSLARPAPGRPALSGRSVEPTVREGGRDALAQQVLRLVDAACSASGVAPQDVRTIGVSSCGPFLLRNGQVEVAAPNICGGLGGTVRGLPNNWTSVPLQAPLRQRFERVRVEIDTIGALEAERRWGALQGMDHCAYVTWSTGIGMGLCVDGHALRGKNGNAGHAGHSFVLDDTSAPCGCGNVGDVEGLVGGNAILRRFGVDAAALLASARAGDAAAASRVDELCRVMGRALYNLVVTLDLQRISLGGSVYWHHRDLLLPKLQAEMTGRLPALTDGCTLVSAGLGAEVGDYGALALVV
jgi:glucokinase